MKTTKSKSNNVKTARILDYLQTSMDRLTRLSEEGKASQEPIQALEAAYYDLLRRNARDVAYELDLFAKKRPASLARASVRAAVEKIIAENNLKKQGVGHIGKLAYDRVEECLRDGFQAFMN